MSIRHPDWRPSVFRNGTQRSSDTEAQDHEVSLCRCWNAETRRRPRDLCVADMVGAWRLRSALYTGMEVSVERSSRLRSIMWDLRRRHLRRVLTLYSLCYDDDAHHLGFGKDTPLSSMLQRQRIARGLQSREVAEVDRRKRGGLRTADRVFLQPSSSPSHFADVTGAATAVAEAEDKATAEVELDGQFQVSVLSTISPDRRGNSAPTQW